MTETAIKMGAYKNSNDVDRGAVVDKSTGEHKYPVRNEGEAHAAISRINQAKPPLSHDQKVHIANEAARFIGQTPGVKAIKEGKR